MTPADPNELEKTRIGETTILSSSSEFQPGQSVGDRYEVISRLGQGGMGLVYRVKQIFVQKEFALKTIDKNCMSEIAVRRFQQEARTAFSLDHPNIIAVNDFGVLQDQTPFLVMELINGETLGERLKKDGCLSLEQAIPLFVQVCFGIAYAHECGVVHRDIKPNNIMLLNGMPPGAEGSVKIVDFGIAKFVGHEGGEIQALTRTGEIFGSPLYMSPEQCGGAQIDQRADIYSLGCVLFETLTGTPPFMGENALSTMMMHQGQQAPTLKEASLGGEFPQAIENIVAKMLAKSPDNRYKSLGIVAHDLAALQRGDSISAGGASSKASQDVATVSITHSSLLTMLVATAVLTAALAGGAVYMLNGQHAAKPSNRTATPPPLPKLSPSVDEPDELDLIETTHKWLKDRLTLPMNNGAFSIGGRKLTKDSFEQLASASQIRSLSMSGCSFSNEDLGRLAKSQIHTIKVCNSTFDDTGAEQLAHWQNLRDAEVYATNITDKGVAELAKIKHLKALNLSDTRVSDDGLKNLSKSTLHTLFLNGAKNISDRGLDYLSQITGLQWIILDHTNVTLQGIKNLCGHNKTIRFVELRHCRALGTKQVQELRNDYPAIQFKDQDKKVDNNIKDGQF